MTTIEVMYFLWGDGQNNDNEVSKRPATLERIRCLDGKELEASRKNVDESWLDGNGFVKHEHCKDWPRPLGGNDGFGI